MLGNRSFYDSTALFFYTIQLLLSIVHEKATCTCHSSVYKQLLWTEFLFMVVKKRYEWFDFVSATCRKGKLWILLKVAPYSFMIARARRTKAQVICARSKGNVSVFQYFITSTWAQQEKLTVNFLAFPLVKFWKTWHTGSKCFTSVGARFSEKSIRPVFLQR